MLEIIAVGVTRLEIMHVRLVMMCLSTAIDKKVLEVDDESIPCFVRLDSVSCSSRCNGYVSMKGKDIVIFFFFILDGRKEWEEKGSVTLLK